MTFQPKFGIPRQSSRVEALKARIVFETEYRNVDACRGLEEFSHIWLIWEFSEAKRTKWSPTVRPPRLGGKYQKGSICHQISVSSKLNWFVLRKTHKSIFG